MRNLDPGLFADAASASGCVEDYDAVVLSAIERAVGCDAAFFVRRGEPSRTSLGLFDDARRLACRDRWRVYAEESDPIVRTADAHHGIAVDVDVLGSRHLERLQYYRDIMQPIGGRSTLFAFARFRGRRVGTLVLGRTSPRFRESEVAALERALPTIAVCESSWGSARRLDALTPRETEVLEYLRLGYTNREIALALGTSVNTVRNQLASIFAKLGATTRAEAVAISLAR